jgi:hypothetical protein
MYGREIGTAEWQAMNGCSTRVADDGVEPLGRSHHSYSIGDLGPPVQLGRMRVQPRSDAYELASAHATPDVRVGAALVREEAS